MNESEPRIEQVIERNLASVRGRIEAACRRAGRSAGEVTIVAVTKTHGPEVVDAAIRAGLEDIGENRIQEFLGKKARVAGTCRWHLVGTLQRNKASKAVGEFHLVHSVDRVALAETLSRLGEDRRFDTRILLEVNTSGEGTKHGFSPDEVVAAAGTIVRLPRLRLEGLMTIGPLTTDAGAIRGSFRNLSALRSRIESEHGVRLPQLSMGMTDDFEIAIEEGATLVRLGRVLFGERSQAAG